MSFIFNWFKPKRHKQNQGKEDDNRVAVTQSFEEDDIGVAAIQPPDEGGTRIVVNHLTRMQQGYICVAGIDLQTGIHIRPVLEYGRLQYTDLGRYGGPFDIGGIVNLGRISSRGCFPEVEDCRFALQHAQGCGHLPANEFWAMLDKAAKSRLRDVFGDDLHKQGATYAVDEGGGIASLGCLKLVRPPVLRIVSPTSVRLAFSNDPDGPSLKVTDLRLYDETQVRRQVVQNLIKKMGRGGNVILSVGLTRAWQKPDDTMPRHWLQVNNIHVEDDPVWQEQAL